MRSDKNWDKMSFPKKFWSSFVKRSSGGGGGGKCASMPDQGVGHNQILPQPVYF